MEDKIIKVEEELAEATINLKTGEKVPVRTKTIYTHYESGKKDCKIIMEKPISLSGEVNKLEDK